MNESKFTKKWTTFIFLSAISSIGCLLTFIFFYALRSSLEIPTGHLDGAFQTASGLFRLDAGQAPGRDFLPYLGIGPLLLIFPFFEIIGGTLSSSVFAAKFVTLLVCWLAISVLWLFIFRPKKAIFSWVGSAVVFLSILINSKYNLIHFRKELYFLFEPGNSLRPIRSSIVYIIAILFYFCIKNNKIRLQRDILAGFLVGISLLWSNDFALPTAGIFILFYILLTYVKENLFWKQSTLTFLLAAFLSWAALLSLITAGHPFAVLKYNFIDVATDQWWYFASYGIKHRIFELSQVTKLLSQQTTFSLKVLFVSSIFAFKTKKIEHVLVALIGLILFSGGCLASIGGHLDGYFFSFYCWGVITTILALIRLTQVVILPVLFKSTWSHAQSVKLLAPASFLFTLYFAIIAGLNYQQDSTNLRTNPEKHFIPELGGYIDTEWKKYIEYAQQNKESNIFEEYWGLWSAVNRRVPSWPVDSVIHALGNVRNVAKSALKDADLFITTRYIYSPEWQPWNLSQNFWFYEELLLHWEPYYISPRTIVWRKSDKLQKEKDVNCQVSQNGSSFILDTEDPGLYKVRIDYSSKKHGRYLIMLQNNISYGADANGYVSLPPGGLTATIPVRITEESGNEFNIKIVGDESIDVRINSCSAKKIFFSNEEVFPSKP